MLLTTNTWQAVPGSRGLEIFPILTKPDIVSSNSFIVSAPAAILVVDPGARPEQTRHISEVVTAALAAAERPVLLFLTHCHQDHSQEADRLTLPEGTELRRLAHDTAARVLARGDRAETVAYLYPWHPEVCRAPIHGRLFAPDEAIETRGLVLSRGGRVDVHGAGTSRSTDGGLGYRSIGLGRGERLDIYHTPGHTGCSLSLGLGALLLIGDLPFAANPGLCGLDGWNHGDLVRTLHAMDSLLDGGRIGICCPGHGDAVAAATMGRRLRLMREEARDLTAVESMNARRITGLKQYTDELLEEASALFTILAGRLYTASYYLFDEGVVAERLPVAIDLDGIDRTLTDFQRFADAFKESEVPELTVVMKGVQAARSLQHTLADDSVQRLLEQSLVGRAQRRLSDFLSIVRGLQFVAAESPCSVNSVLAQLAARAVPHAHVDPADVLALAADQRSFLDVLTRRIAAHSPLNQISVDVVRTSWSTDADIAADRLDDIVTSLIEGMAAAGATRVHLSTEAAHTHVLVRLSSDVALTVAAIGRGRLALYGRTLGWLGGSLHCEESSFVLRLPAVHPCGNAHANVDLHSA